MAHGRSRTGACGSAHRYRYRTLPDSDMSDNDVFKVPLVEDSDDLSTEEESVKERWWTRDRYLGALLFNICTFILPALYGTLSKLWIAQLDSKMVVTTDTYTYISTVTEVINEGLPRAVFVIIGDRDSRTITSRIRLSNTLILFQTILGGILSVVIAAAAPNFAKAFVPIEVRKESLQYIRISAFSSVFGAVDMAVSSATRALDRPDVPLVISSVKTALNIILDILFLSKVRVGHLDVDVNTQAIIRLSCDAAGAIAGVAFYLYEVRILFRNRPLEEIESRKPSKEALWTLTRQGWYTFMESLVRNVLYLWLVSGIVAMGSDYATVDKLFLLSPSAWGVFNTIRWGLIMVPVQALEATSSTFVGHAWGSWRARVGANNRKPKASWKDLLVITRPAFISTGIALMVEIPLCVFFSLWGARSFAYWLSGNGAVADITAYMWRTIDWCYIFYAISTQLASILIATRPRWYLFQSLCANIFWVLPWAIVVSTLELNKDTAWKWDSIIFGGSLVISFIIVVLFLASWGWRLNRGLSTLSPVATPLLGVREVWKAVVGRFLRYS